MAVTAVLLFFLMAADYDSPQLKLAEKLRADGRLLEAAEMYRKAIDNPDPRVRLYALNGLSVTELSLGELASAERTLKRTLQMVDKEFQPDPVNRSVVLCNIGSMYIRRGQPEKAQPLLEQAYSTLKSAIGPGSAQTVRARDNLAVSLHLQHRFDDALGLLEESLEAQRRMKPANPEMAITLTNIATILIDLKRFPEAETRLQSALQLLSATHPDYARCLLAQARLYRRQKRWAEAASTYLSSARGFERSAGANHFLYATVVLEYLSLPKRHVDKKQIGLSKEAAQATLEIHQKENMLGTTVEYGELVRTFRQ